MIRVTFLEYACKRVFDTRDEQRKRALQEQSAERKRLAARAARHRKPQRGSSTGSCPMNQPGSGLDNQRILIKIEPELTQAGNQYSTVKLEHCQVLGETKLNRTKPRRITPELPTLNTRYVRKLIMLLKFLNIQSWTWGKSLNIDRALFHILFARGQYDQVHWAIKQSFERGHYKHPLSWDCEIEALWNYSAYEIDSTIQASVCSKRPSGKEKSDHPAKPNNPTLPTQTNPNGCHLGLTPVKQYRIRKRYICPTIKRSGGKRYNISSIAKERLDSFFEQKSKPSKLEKRDIARRTGLAEETVANWFKNQRQRRKQSDTSSNAGTEISRDTLAIGTTSGTKAEPLDDWVSSQEEELYLQEAAYIIGCQEVQQPQQYSIGYINSWQQSYPVYDDNSFTDPPLRQVREFEQPNSYDCDGASTNEEPHRQYIDVSSRYEIRLDQQDYDLYEIMTDFTLPLPFE